MSKLIYTMFIRNTRSSFHWWRQSNLVKHRKVSRYYETDCSQNFLSLFVFLWKIKILKNFHIQDRVLFICLKKSLKETSSYLYNKFQPQWIEGRTNYQVRHMLGLTCQLIALILLENSAKGLRVVKHIKALIFKGFWDALE